MSGIIAALISGTLMSVQGVFNTQVTRQTGTWVTNTFVQFTAFLVCLLIWLIRESKQTPLSSLLSVKPGYLLTGGLIGAFITFTVIAGMSSLGPARAVMLIVCAQLLAAYFIELLGLFGVDRAGFDWRKLLGTGLFLAGIIVFKMKG